MNFKRGPSKPTQPPSGKQSGGITLSGFSFKQLEEDEEDEDKDITKFTGKYEKLVEESQKTQRKSHERTPSNSSVSSTSSLPGDGKSLEKPSTELAREAPKAPAKPASLLPQEAVHSPIRSAARAKFETSKELFSGLKGRITDKISKTIEEFSGESSSSPSPEKEIAKSLPVQRKNSLGTVEKETVPVLRSQPPGTEGLLTVENSRINNDLPARPSSSSLVESATSSLLNDEILFDSQATAKEYPQPRGRAFTAPTKTLTPLTSFESVQDHPLARSDLDDAFEDVIEPLETDIFSRNIHDSKDDASEFHDPQTAENKLSIEVCEEYFIIEPLEDFTGQPGLVTSTQLRPRSKVKCLLQSKGTKTSAVATMSGLHGSPDKKPVSQLATETPKPEIRLEGEHQDPSAISAPPVATSSSYTPSAILRQFGLDNVAIPYQRLCTIAVVLFAYLIIPLPSYISGFLMGTFLASLGWFFYMWLMEPPHLLEPVLLSPIMEQSRPVPEMKLTTESEEFLYKGWMNELTDYNPDDYHINKTHSVYVSLEGSHLRLQRPKNAIPKRAMWDEVLPKPQFIHQRHFDLPGSSVFLQPQGLVKKRIWSKKYPICVAVASKSSTHDDAKIKHISSEPVISSAVKKDKISDMGFEIVTESKCDHNILYLFARTGREKEDWFKRLAAAASGKPLGNHVLELKQTLSKNVIPHKKSTESLPRLKREGSSDSMASTSSQPEAQSELAAQKEAEQSSNLLTFAHYMGRLMPAGSLSPSHTASGRDLTKDTANKSATTSKDGDEVKVLNPSGPIICDSQLFWINALIGRCFFDFLRDKWWVSKVTEKLQRKLSKIHVPYFIEELQVTDINMGYEMPSIRNAGRPYIDERGFWVDLSITYSGGFQMTIETKMNLMKLKKSPHQSVHSGHSVDSAKSPITDSDEEDSAESSTEDEEEAPANSEDSSTGGGASKKLLRYLNKITQSKYFQQATEYKVIKRAMENVSNTPLTLTVTVNSLVGKLALNIPPPPSDRLWYGFRGNPSLRLSAKPQVGERAVTITHVVEWIEKKLAIEFQRVFVMPNMDDLVIPILVPGEVSGVQMSHSMSV